MGLDNPMLPYGAGYPAGRVERLRAEDEEYDEDEVSLAELDSLVDSMGEVAADMQRILDERKAANTRRQE